MAHTGRLARLPIPRGARLRAGVVIAIAAATGISACSQISHVTTARAVSNSLSNVTKQTGLSLRFSIGLTPAQISQLATKGGVSSKLAQTLSQTAIFISFQTGHGETLKSTKADPNDSFDFGLQVGTSTPIELRYVGQSLYLRAQVAELLTDYGQDPNKAASLQAGLQKLDAYVPGLGALGQGQWVSVTKASLQPVLGLLKQFASSSSAQGQSKQLSGAYTKLIADLKSTLKNNSTYTNAGNHNGRTQYDITIALRSFVQQAATDVQADLSSLPGGVGSTAQNSITKVLPKVPSSAVLQLFVKNNKAQEVDVDINQFLPAQSKAPFAVPIRLEIGDATPITAPSGATQLDLSKIGSLLGGLFTGGGLAAGSTTPTT